MSSLYPSQIQQRAQGMSDALYASVDPSAPLTDAGKMYRSMSLLEMGREYLGMFGVDTRGMSRIELTGAMLQHRGGGSMATGDFTALLVNAASKRLRKEYAENPGSYVTWARKAPNAPDFKPITVVAMAGAPDLLRVNEHGEFKYGSLSDGKETYNIITYGRIVSLTRQALVNDDLRAFDRLVQSFANSARRLENRLVYSELTANAALADTGLLFNSTAVATAGGHANLATGGGSALSAPSLAAGRAAIRLQKGLQSEELNLAPRFLIVPAALEQLAYQYTSAQYVPATASAVNEFRSGGRTALEPVVEPLLDSSSSTAWYLAASSNQVDTVEYCYLGSDDGPVIESETGFSTDGMRFRCRHDFAAKAVDFRGLYKAAGV